VQDADAGQDGRRPRGLKKDVAERGSDQQDAARLGALDPVVAEVSAGPSATPRRCGSTSGASSRCLCRFCGPGVADEDAARQDPRSSEYSASVAIRRSDCRGRFPGECAFIDQGQSLDDFSIRGNSLPPNDKDNVPLARVGGAPIDREPPATVAPLLPT
jgi:hypothetical protein